MRTPPLPASPKNCTVDHRCRIAAWLALAAAPVLAQSFRFAVLGDRTGEANPGVYEEALKEAAAENPAFVIAVGDSIEGLEDGAAESEWRAFDSILRPYRNIPFYPVPGNHDIWSPASEKLFRTHAGRAPHYSFDFRLAHFTILDNSRSADLSPDEIAFLEKDLRTHAAQPVKLVVSHRPSWLLSAIVQSPNFALHQLAKKYGVQMVLAGHVHEMLHVELEGVQYISMPSAGGHLRASRKYEDGWFFGYALAEVEGPNIRVQVKELKPPHGRGRVTRPDEWGAAGLVKRAAGALP